MGRTWTLVLAVYLAVVYIRDRSGEVQARHVGAAAEGKASKVAGAQDVPDVPQPESSPSRNSARAPKSDASAFSRDDDFDDAAEDDDVDFDDAAAAMKAPLDESLDPDENDARSMKDAAGGGFSVHKMVVQFCTQ